MEIEVKNLKRYFGSTHAVDDISFTFQGGQVYGFVGPNGSGKTTTMRIMATLDEPTQGDVLLDGVSVVQDPEKVRRLIGFMPDSLPTHRDVTVHEYLDFFARAYGLRGRARRTTIQEIESFTNLHNLREKRLRALSKGMKQRVSLARALVHDPALLIMDEPAAGLDPRARVELRELLKILAKHGKAILISSHILTELAEICDGAAIIERGRLLKAGSLDALYHDDGDAPEDDGQPHKSRRGVAVRCHGDNEKLHKALLEMPLVDKARIEGDYVEADVIGDKDDCCELLAELLRRDFRILEFKQARRGLEQLFMSVTKGDVQ